MKHENTIGLQDYWAATVALLGAIKYQSWDMIAHIEKVSPNQSYCNFNIRVNKNQPDQEQELKWDMASRRYWADTFEKYLQIQLPSFREDNLPKLSQEEWEFCTALAKDYLPFIKECATHIAAHKTLSGADMEQLFNDMGLTLY